MNGLSAAEGEGAGWGGLKADGLGRISVGADGQSTGGIAGELCDQTADGDGTGAADGEGIGSIHRRGIDGDGEAAARIGDGELGVAIAGDDRREASFLSFCAKNSSGSTGELQDLNRCEVGEVAVNDGCGSSGDDDGVGLGAARDGGRSELILRELKGVSAGASAEVDGTTS